MPIEAKEQMNIQFRIMQEKMTKREDQDAANAEAHLRGIQQFGTDGGLGNNDFGDTDQDVGCLQGLGRSRSPHLQVQDDDATQEQCARDSLHSLLRCKCSGKLPHRWQQFC